MFSLTLQPKEGSRWEWHSFQEELKHIGSKQFDTGWTYWIERNRQQYIKLPEKLKTTPFLIK